VFSPQDVAKVADDLQLQNLGVKVTRSSIFAELQRRQDVRSGRKPIPVSKYEF
jgi:hypothetical protein